MKYGTKPEVKWGMNFCRRFDVRFQGPNLASNQALLSVIVRPVINYRHVVFLVSEKQRQGGR